MELDGKKIILCEPCNDSDWDEEAQLIDIHCFALCAKDVSLQEIADHIEVLLNLLVHYKENLDGHN